MTTRSCARCGEQKSIQGVWYLLSRASAFMCESCFRAGRDASPPAAIQARTLGPAPTPSLLDWAAGPSGPSRLPR